MIVLAAGAKVRQLPLTDTTTQEKEQGTAINKALLYKAAQSPAALYQDWKPTMKMVKCIKKLLCNGLELQTFLVCLTQYYIVALLFLYLKQVIAHMDMTQWKWTMFLAHGNF